MTTVLDRWATDHRIPPHALVDLKQRIGMLYDANAPQVDAEAGGNEAAVQARIRLEASRKGLRLWRNNVGAGYDDAGNFMRWGLANDSKQVNAVFKSGDLIGIRPVVVTPPMVGLVIGQFVSREVKRAGWSYKGTPREVAQENWANLINSLGGDAQFATGEGTL